MVKAFLWFVALLVVQSCVLPENGGDAAKPGSQSLQGAGGTSDAAGLYGAGGGVTAVDATGGCSGANSNGGGNNAGDSSYGGATTGCNCGTGGASQCTAGFDDCDHTGQCVPLYVPEHCGTCGKNCMTPSTADSTIWQCENSTCVVNGCKPNFADCDQMAGNGCEVNISSDPAHCGGCVNSSCDYSVCSNGVCAPTVVCGNPAVPDDLASAPLYTVRPNTVFGVRQMLNYNDAIVGFGAVINASSAIFLTNFQMALYDCDSNYAPQSLLLSTAMPEYSTTADMIAKNGLVERKLTKPFYVPSQNWYWIMVWVESTDILDLVISNFEQAYDVRSAGNVTQWPTGTSWQTGFVSVPPNDGYKGLFPHIFVTYVPAS